MQPIMKLKGVVEKMVPSRYPVACYQFVFHTDDVICALTTFEVSVAMTSIINSMADNADDYYDADLEVGMVVEVSVLGMDTEVVSDPSESRVHRNGYVDDGPEIVLYADPVTILA